MRRPTIVGSVKTCLLSATLVSAAVLAAGCEAGNIIHSLSPNGASVTIEPALGTGSGTVAGSGFSCDLAATEHTGTCFLKVEQDQEIILAATPSESNVFVAWGGACASAGTDKCLIKVSSATTVTAQFDPVSVTLDVQTAGGTGTGTVSGNGLDCTITPVAQTGRCSVSLLPSTVALLTATPASGGNVFTRWVGACSGAVPTCSVSMSSARTVAANFSAPNLLTVLSGGGAGSGSVTATGIDCAISATIESGSCSASFAPTSSVVLTARPGTGQSFDGWGGACFGVNPTCTVSMATVQTVTARFGGGGSFPLSVSSGGGNGSGTVSGSGLNCTIASATQAGACAISVATGTAVVLTATAAASNSFAGWGGACAGSTTTCTVTMQQARAVTASFTTTTPTFSLTVVQGTGNGVGNVAGSGVTCDIALATSGAHSPTASGTCVRTFASGTSVTLTAVPAADGYTFVGWTGDCTGTAACALNMTQSRVVGARFDAPSLADVQSQVFTPVCASCHTTFSTPANSFAYLVGVQTVYREPANPFPLATTYPVRVVPYDALNSYVLQQVNKIAGSFRMPTSATVVAPNLVALLTNWINGGALATNPQ